MGKNLHSNLVIFESEGINSDSLDAISNLHSNLVIFECITKAIGDIRVRGFTFQSGDIRMIKKADEQYSRIVIYIPIW